MSEVDRGDIRASMRLSFFCTVAAGLLQLASTVVLARLLMPADYGTYALCVAIVGLAPVFVVNVIARTLVVTEPPANERDETPVISLLCVTAGAVAVAACLAVNSIAAGSVDIGVLVLLAGAACIGSLSIMPSVVLRRQIRFGPLVLVELTALAVGQGAAIFAQLAAGWGAYALAAGAVVQSGVTALLLRPHMRGRAIAAPSARHAVRLIRAATALGGNAATEIVHGQMPGLLLGVRLGASPLGLFNRTYSLVQMPIQLLVSSLGRVSVPALFAVREERERLRAAARSLVRSAAAIVTPVAAGMAGASHNFILVVLGERWLEAAAIVPLVALAGWATMMGTLFGTVSEAMRAFAERTRLQLVATAALVAFVLSGSLYGLAGAVAGIAAASATFLLLFVRLTARLLEHSMASLLGWLAPGLVVGLPCFAVSWLLGVLWDAPVSVVFGAQVLGCGAVAVVLTLAFFPALLLAIVEAGCPAALRLAPALERILRRGVERNVS